MDSNWRRASLLSWESSIIRLRVFRHWEIRNFLHSLVSQRDNKHKVLIAHFPVEPRLDVVIIGENSCPQIVPHWCLLDKIREHNSHRTATLLCTIFHCVLTQRANHPITWKNSKSCCWRGEDNLLKFKPASEWRWKGISLKDHYYFECNISPLNAPLPNVGFEAVQKLHYFTV